MPQLFATLFNFGFKLFDDASHVTQFSLSKRGSRGAAYASVAVGKNLDRHI